MSRKQNILIDSSEHFHVDNYHKIFHCHLSICLIFYDNYKYLQFFLFLNCIKKFQLATINFNYLFQRNQINFEICVKLKIDDLVT